MLGTDTLAVYADDHFLTPHLYAAGMPMRRWTRRGLPPMDLAVLNNSRPRMRTGG